MTVLALDTKRRLRNEAPLRWRKEKNLKLDGELSFRLVSAEGTEVGGDVEGGGGEHRLAAGAVVFDA